MMIGTDELEQFVCSSRTALELKFGTYNLYIYIYIYDQFKVVANKDFGHSRKWILTYQICNAVVLDHLFQL